MVSSLKQDQKETVDFRTALVFGLPAILSVTAVRLFLMPIIPEELFLIGHVVISRRMVTLGLCSDNDSSRFKHVENTKKRY